jgi:hypothetical protein
MRARCALIIPIGPGDHAFCALLLSLKSALPEFELHLACCRSADVEFASVWLAEQGIAASVHVSDASRALQQNYAAERSQADWLWFVHADSGISADVLRQVNFITSQAELNALYYFRLGFDVPSWRMSINKFGVWLRCRLFRLPFGDQAFLMHRDTFNRLGTFPQHFTKGEDHALVWRAKALKITIAMLPAVVRTSARRYQSEGWLRTTVQHLRMTWQQARAMRAWAYASPHDDYKTK